TDNGRFDTRGIHAREQLFDGLSVAKQRLSEKDEGIDCWRCGHAVARTRASNSWMFSAKTCSSSSGLNSARRTLWTSNFGRQPGPSDANSTRRAPIVSIARRIWAGYGIADVSR